MTRLDPTGPVSTDLGRSETRHRSKCRNSPVLHTPDLYTPGVPPHLLLFTSKSLSF